MSIIGLTVTRGGVCAIHRAVFGCDGDTVFQNSNVCQLTEFQALLPSLPPTYSYDALHRKG